MLTSSSTGKDWTAPAYNSTEPSHIASGGELFFAEFVIPHSLHEKPICRRAERTDHFHGPPHVNTVAYFVRPTFPFTSTALDDQELGMRRELVTHTHVVSNFGDVAGFT